MELCICNDFFDLKYLSANGSFNKESICAAIIHPASLEISKLSFYQSIYLVPLVCHHCVQVVLACTLYYFLRMSLRTLHNKKYIWFVTQINIHFRGMIRAKNLIIVQLKTLFV